MIFKYSFLIISLLTFSSHLMAAEGVVKVLEAPLFREENLQGNVVQYVRKGDKIYIHDSALRGEDYVPMDTVFSDSEEIIERNPKHDSHFLATIDNQGRVAYIPKEYVDITYKDEREFHHSKFAKDPTDYRLKEPLPRDYPLYSPSGVKAFFTLGLGPNPKNNYQYPGRIKSESFGQNFDMTTSLHLKASKDYRDRFYYGGMLHLLRDQSRFELENGTADEIEMKIGLGPFISYDPFVSDHFKFTVYTSLLFNFYNLHAVSQSTDSGFKEGRAFSGTTFSPRFGFMVNFMDISPDRMEKLDFLIGTSLMTEYPRKLVSRDAPVIGKLWQKGAGDQINNAALTATVFVGLQKRY